MKFRVKKSDIGGTVMIPGSKSHTIRALTFALLAKGKSVIERPLESSDTASCVNMIGRLGARVEKGDRSWEVTGTGGAMTVPDDVIDVGNSGTSLYIGLGVASLLDGAVVFTGDHQIRNRPAGALMKSLRDLGCDAFSTRGNDKPPLVVRGPIRGGETSIEAVTSQYLTSLLIAAPMARGDSRIAVPLLYEKPYVTMTLAWLDRLGIRYANHDYREFLVPGNQEYRPFRAPVPADFSSATFFLAAGAITGRGLVLEGLDFNDTQGDKEVVDILRKMGARVEIGEGKISIRSGGLKGGVFDLNAIPDSLPALAVTACFAEGETRLVNVPQARLKETDRIRVMARELSKLGASIDELPDGLVIRKSALSGGSVEGHGDHRVVMALAVAGLACPDGVEISTAESVAVTFPGFPHLMRGIGAEIIETEGD